VLKYGTRAGSPASCRPTGRLNHGTIVAPSPQSASFRLKLFDILIGFWLTWPRSGRGPALRFAGQRRSHVPAPSSHVGAGRRPMTTFREAIVSCGETDSWRAWEANSGLFRAIPGYRPKKTWGVSGSVLFVPREKEGLPFDSPAILRSLDSPAGIGSRLKVHCSGACCLAFLWSLDLGIWSFYPSPCASTTSAASSC
jgi:hypothetical protein